MQQGGQDFIHQSTTSRKEGLQKPYSIKNSLLLFIKKYKVPVISIPALAIITPATIFALSSNNGNSQQQNSRINYSSKNDSINPVENISSKQSDQNSNNSQSTTVNVNGEKITIPNNGEYTKTIVEKTGTTKISSISKSSSSSYRNYSNSNASYVNIKVESSGDIRSP